MGVKEKESCVARNGRTSEQMKDSPDLRLPRTDLGQEARTRALSSLPKAEVNSEQCVSAISFVHCLSHQNRI